MKLSLFRRWALCSAIISPAFAEDVTAKINFEEHLKPIFREHCFSCHNQNDKKGGLALDSFAALMEGGGSGEIVVDGDLASSRLYQLMAHVETPVMPPKQNKLADDKLAVVRNWINGGMLENSGSKAKKKSGPSLSFTVKAGKPEGPPPMPEGLLRQPVVTSERASTASALAASPFSPLVAIGGQRQVLLYHSETGELLGVLPFPEGVPQSIRFSRDGGYLVVGGGRHAAIGIAAFYDVRTGNRLATVGDELDTVLSADVNNRLTQIALGGPQRLVRVFDVADGKQLFELKKHTDWVYAVAFSPDGVLIASGDRSGGLHLWEATTGRFYLDLIGHKGAISSVAWRPDGNVIASVSEDGTAKLWDVFEGKLLKSWEAHKGGATDIAYTQDGRIVTSGKDKTVRVWDAAGTQKAVMPAMAEPVLEVAAMGDGARVVGGDWAGNFLAWKPEAPTDAVMLVSNPPSLEQRIATLQPLLESTKQSADQAGATSLDKSKVAEAAFAQQATVATQLDALQTKLAASKELASQLKSQLDAVQQQRDQLTQDRTATAVKSQALVADIQAADQTKATLEQTLQSTTQQFMSVSMAKSDSERILSESSGKLLGLQKQFEVMALGIAESRKKFDAATGDEKSMVEQVLKEQLASSDSISKLIAETQSTIEKAKESLAGSNVTLANVESAKAAALTKYSEAATQRQLVAGESESSAKRLAALTQELEKLEPQVTDLANRHATATSDLQLTEKQIEQMTPQLKSLAESAEAAKQVMAAAATEAAATKQRMETSQTEFKRYQDELVRFQSMQQRLLAVVEQSATSVEAASNQLKAPQDALATMEAQRTQQQAEMDQLVAQVQKLQTALQGTQPQLDAAKIKLAELQAAADAAEAAATMAKSQLELFQSAYGAK